MNILVTGATGFVGRHLIPSLLSSNNRIILLVRNNSKAEILFGDKVEYLDTNQLSGINQCSPEIIIHLAAYLTSKNDDESLDKLLQSNIFFGAKLLNALKDCPSLRLFINFGTFAEYRYGPMSINNAYLYSATKSAFKQLLAYYADLSGYKQISLIPYTIYGGEDSQKKVIDFIKDSFNAKESIKMSGGEQILDFIHISDVVSLLTYIIANLDKFIKEPTCEYHLGSGIGTSLRDVAQMLEKKYEKKCNIVWGRLPYRERDVMYAVAPIGKLISMGWKPRKNLKDNL